MDSTQSVLDSIRSIVRALRVSSRSAEKSCGLSTAQLFVLRSLSESHGVSINDLAAKTLTHQSSVSVVVKKLEEQGLVLRRSSKSDARRAELSLSKKGAAKLSKAPVLVQEQLLAGLQGLKSDERDQLAHLLSKFLQSADIQQTHPPLLFEEST